MSRTLALAKFAVASGAAAFFAFGFFVSRLLRFWPLAMANSSASVMAFPETALMAHGAHKQR